MTTRRRWLVRALAWLGPVGAYAQASPAHNAAPATSTPSSTTSSLRSLLMSPAIALDTRQWKTMPFGRLLIQVPPEASTSGKYSQWGDTLERRPDLSSLALLNQEVVAQQNTFKRQSHVNFGTRYITTHNLNGRGYSVWGYEFDKASSLNGRHYRVTHNYFFDPQLFRVWYMKSDVGQDNITTALAYLEALARQTRALAPGEIPKEYGFVIDGGIVRTDEWMGEFAELYIDLPFFINPLAPKSHLGSLSIQSMVRGKLGEKLLDRLSPLQGLLAPFLGVKVLRKRDLVVNGIAGQEYLYRERSSDDRWSAYAFVWEAQGKVDDNYAPNITVEMRVNLPSSQQYPEPPFKTDADALAFWDAMLNTLRLRPVIANDGREVSQSGAIEAPVTCGSEQIAPRTGVYRGTLPLDHPSAAYFHQSGVNYAYVEAGKRMIRLGVHGQEHLVTWTWIRATREA